MIAPRHLSEGDLALYASGDLAFGLSLLARLHMSQCVGCRERLAEYTGDREAVRIMAGELPANVQWDRLSAEMTANIRVGLAAGECVAPRVGRRDIPVGWRVAAAVTGFSFLLVAAWWLNMPPAETASLHRAFQRIAQARPWQGGRFAALEDSGPVVEATATGIGLHENGASLRMSQGAARPVAVSLSVQGAARARYIDSDTGQVTITSVYAQ
jgi:hypothetical protein